MEGRRQDTDGFRHGFQRAVFVPAGNFDVGQHTQGYREIDGEGVGPGSGQGTVEFDRLFGSGERLLPSPEIAQLACQVFEGPG